MITGYKELTAFYLTSRKDVSYTIGVYLSKYENDDGKFNNNIILTFNDDEYK